ncbi:nuclear fragile X mental retardation protein interacting protein 1, partial [Rhizophlyctis rosea]
MPQQSINFVPNNQQPQQQMPFMPNAMMGLGAPALFGAQMNPMYQQQLLQLQQQQLLIEHQQQQLMQAHLMGMTTTWYPGQQQPQHPQPQAPQPPQNYTPSEHYLQATPVPPTEPPPAPYRCENCEKDFQHASQYHAHNASHKKCSQCDFEASGKMVALHEEEVHALVGGVKKLPFVSTESPAEIEKWIADRKKNWPSEGNIHKKMVEQEERIARGDVIDHSKSGLKAESQKPKENQTTQDHSLSLLSSYASGDELSLSSSDEEDLEQPPVPLQPQPRKSNWACKYFARGNCRKGDACSFRHEERPRGGEEKDKTRNSVAAALSQLKQNRRPLLRMLLENDIKKEKSALLQAIRYIVQNNFFQEPEPDDGLLVNPYAGAVDQ